MFSDSDSNGLENDNGDGKEQAANPFAGCEIRATECEPIAAWISNLGHKQRVQFTVLTAAAVATLLVLANLVQGSLLHPGVNVLASDLDAIILRREPRVISASFPLLRDYPTILLYPIIGTWLVAVFQQWQLFNTAVPHIYGSGIYQTEKEDRKRILAEVDKVNSHIDAMRNRTSLYVLGAVVLTLAVLFAQTQSGIFGILGPNVNNAVWSQDAYAGWWGCLLRCEGTAGSLPNVLGFCIYYATIGVAMYYLILQNSLGVRIVLGFRRIGSVSTGHFDMLNPDGWYGWLVIRKIAITVYWSALVSAAALAGLVLVVSLDQLYWLVALGLVLFVLSPAYLFVFLRWVWVELGRDKTRVREKVLSALPSGTDPANYCRAEIDAGRNTLAAVRRAPRVPFRVGAAIAGVVLYVVPIVSLVVAVMTL